MRQVGLVSGAILILIGLVWALQGLDVVFAPESFMTGDTTWVIWGGLAIVIGATIIWRSTRDRGR